MSLFFGYDMPPGLIPLVVGVVSTPEGLEKAAATDAWPCDIVEIRLDLIGDDVSDWPVAALRLTKAGAGTLLTVRHQNEGGRWNRDEHARLDAYIQGIPHVTGIDIELSASILPDVMALARDRITTLGSFHNFRATPSLPELEILAQKGHEAGVDVVKMAAFASGEDDVARMEQWLGHNTTGPALCALAMGPLGPASRIRLPLAGSCLSYGYLDKPTVNGQPSAADIRAHLLENHEEYRIFAEAKGYPRLRQH